MLLSLTTLLLELFVLCWYRFHNPKEKSEVANEKFEVIIHIFLFYLLKSLNY